MKRLNNIFFTSDWHLFHENVIKFSNRPFKSIDHMHEILVNNYNASVKNEDTCYFLGDMSMGSVDKTFDIISKLNGKKVVILGNHDKKTQSMYNSGFDVVMYGCKLLISNHIVTMSHCPLFGIKREDTASMSNGNPDENWHGEKRKKLKIFGQDDFGQFHLHGHIHSPNGGKSEKILDRQYDVGVDANNYRPVSISQIESWISLTKNLRTDK